MPERTTVVLPGPLKERAVARAREQGISFGEFVRRAVENMLTPPRGTGRKKTGDPFWDNLKAYDGGPEDSAARHDDHLYGRKS
jgi:ribosomal protein L13